MRRSLLAIAFLSAGISSLHAGWGSDGIWNDGRAEVAVYDSEKIIDGKVRMYKEHLITMKDMTAPKKDRPFYFREIQTIELENYPRNYLTEVVVDGENGRLARKVIVGVQDWNGNSVKVFNDTDIELKADDYFEEQLPLSLRALPFKDGIEKKVRIWNVSASSVATVSEALLSISAGDTIRHRNSIPCWLVSLKRGDKIDKYWFEKKSPNILVKMETADGRKRLLYGRSRWTFWDRRIPRPNILK